MRHFIRKAANWIGRAALPLSFFALILLDFVFRYLYKTTDSIPVLSWTPFLFTVCWALLLCGLLYMLPVTARRVVLIVLFALTGLLCLVHGVLYNLFGHFFSLADLAYTGDGAKFFSFSYLRIRKGLIVCVVLCILFSIIAAVNLPRKKWRLRQLFIGLAIIAVAVSGIALQQHRILSQVNETLTWSNAAEENDGNCYKNMNNINRSLSICGIYQYLYRNFVVTTGMEYQAQYEELDEYYAASPKYNHEENAMTGACEGDNLLFIMLESIDTWMITEEYMPHLYALQQESVNFENHYTPLYITAGTFNTEFIANTSLIPPTNGIDTTVYSKNEFSYSLPRLFENAGYTANSFHSAGPGIYNRGAIHQNLGYEAYHSYIDMNMDNYMLDSQLTNGFDLMTENEPFFSFIITYSGHGPYTDDMHEISDAHIAEARELVAKQNIQASDSDLSEYTYAIAHAMETDAFIGNLMDKLEESGHREDTTVILFTDHYSKYMTNREFVMELKGVSNTDLLCRTPFMIWSADLAPQTVTKVTSTMDIAPTVANLFSLDAPYQYFTGDDIFGSGGGYVIFAGNNWYDGVTYYSPNYSGEVTEEIAQRNREISQRINVSWDTLRCDYFRYLQNRS